MSPLDYILLGAIALAAALAVRSAIKHRGGCGDCSCCPYHSAGGCGKSCTDK